MNGILLNSGSGVYGTSVVLLGPVLGRVLCTFGPGKQQEGKV